MQPKTSEFWNIYACVGGYIASRTRNYWDLFSDVLDKMKMWETKSTLKQFQLIMKQAGNIGHAVRTLYYFKYS